jgi:hypothetical protein
MNTDDIIRMAREAGFDPHDMSADFTCNLKDIERFAALVEEERSKKYPIAFTHEEYNAVIDAARADGAAAEREGCAKLAAWILKMPENDVSAAIQARGKGE